jgi:hypothetical protein
MPSLTYLQRHQNQFPTLAAIALDVLPIPATSVPCERLFSSAKLTAVDRRARLGAERFEELQLMKWAWMPVVAESDCNVLVPEEEIVVAELTEMLEQDMAALSMESECDELVEVSDQLAFY